jgi:hypothetical protein
MGSFSHLSSSSSNNNNSSSSSSNNITVETFMTAETMASE